MISMKIVCMAMDKTSTYLHVDQRDLTHSFQVLLKGINIIKSLRNKAQDTLET